MLIELRCQCATHKHEPLFGVQCDGCSLLEGAHWSWASAIRAAASGEWILGMAITGRSACFDLCPACAVRPLGQTVLRNRASNDERVN